MKVYNLWLVNAITVKGKVFRFTQSVPIVVRLQEETYIIENKSLNMLSWGDSFPKAVENFCNEFNALWEHIALISDEILSVGAQILKRRLLAIMEEVVDTNKDYLGFCDGEKLG